MAKCKHLVDLGKGNMMFIVFSFNFSAGLKIFKINNWKKIWDRGRNIRRAVKTLCIKT